MAVMTAAERRCLCSECAMASRTCGPRERDTTMVPPNVPSLTGQDSSRPSCLLCVGGDTIFGSQESKRTEWQSCTALPLCLAPLRSIATKRIYRLHVSLTHLFLPSFHIPSFPQCYYMILHSSCAHRDAMQSVLPSFLPRCSEWGTCNIVCRRTNEFPGAITITPSTWP